MDKPIVVLPPKLLELPDLKLIWEYRDLLYFLIKRDLKTRFQQTFIGVLWIVFQPLIQMLIFYVILGLFVKVPTGDIPYPVFYLSGFVVWQVFQQIVNGSAYSLTMNIGIITKTYFPRLVFPLSITAGAVIDFLVSFSVLLVFLLVNHNPITTRYLLIPVLLVLTLAFSLGIGLLFGALMVVFRDTKNLLAFIMQIWLFATPIMYPITIVPEQFKFIFYFNPLTGLIGAFRWVFFPGEALPATINLVISFGAAVLLLAAGLMVFRQMETRIADVM